MNKRITVFLICLAVTLPLTAYELELPEVIRAYWDMEMTLKKSSGDSPIDEARFYVVEPGKTLPTYVDFEYDEEEQLWKGVFPGTYIVGEVLEYFVEILSEDGVIYGIPEAGTMARAITPDTIPPQLELVLPVQGELMVRLPQAVIILVQEAAEITRAEVRVNGEYLEDVEIIGDIIKVVYTPKTLDTVQMEITVEDNAGNVSQETIVLLVEGELKEPFATAEGNWYAGLDLTYTLDSSQDSNELPGQLLDDMEHRFELGYSLGGEGTVNLGRLFSLKGSIDLSDSRDVLEYLDVYPSTLVSDFRDIMRLWHPWNFEQEFAFDPEKDVREFDSVAEISLEASLLWDMLTYKFGDQRINFQDQTVKDLYFRGSSVDLDLYLLNIKVGKGLIDLGLKETAWPRNFVGFQAGLDLFDVFWLQTNLSIISDFQGRYDELGAGGKPIGDMYGLNTPGEEIPPVSNIVMGVGTGFQTPWFKLAVDGGFTLYVDDISEVIDLETLAELIEEQAPDLDMTEYLNYVDTIESYFPVFDYFPPNEGIISTLLGRKWGITYGVRLDIPDLGLEGWYRKTDNAYRSLGASLTNDSFSYGGVWTLPLSNWRASLGYSWSRNKVQDILSNELLPLLNIEDVPFVSGDPDADPTEQDIANITHQGTLKVQTPNLGAFGRIAADYGLQMKLNNAVDLGFLDKEQFSMVHTGTGAWRSRNYRFNMVSLSLSLRSKNSYTMNKIVDGEEDGSSFWNLNGEGSARIGFGNISLSPSYRRDWGTEDSVVKQIVKTSLSFRDLWFDAITVAGQWEEITDDGAWDERTISGEFSLRKSFGMMQAGVDLKGSYTDSADGNSDATSVGLKVWGGISL